MQSDTPDMQEKIVEYSSSLPSPVMNCGFLSGESSEEALTAELLQSCLEPLVTNTLEECQGMVALFMVAEATFFSTTVVALCFFFMGEALEKVTGNSEIGSWAAFYPFFGNHSTCTADY
jgi:hypothetical protein